MQQSPGALTQPTYPGAKASTLRAHLLAQRLRLLLQKVSLLLQRRQLLCPRRQVHVPLLQAATPGRQHVSSRCAVRRAV